MSVSDLDQERRPRHRWTSGIPAVAIVVAVTLASLQAPSFAARAEPAITASQGKMSRGDQPALPPSREITSSIGALAAPKTPPHPVQTSTLPRDERITLISLLALCFGVMAFGGFRLWRRSVDDLMRSEGSRRDGHQG
ncbi:hypothetical protein [Rhizobium wuzhouense]|nr:hypothetical protein [Rhizobium wuzhouense]